MKAYILQFSKIGKCLSKIRKEQLGTLVMIAPVWQAQPWYPIFLEMIIQKPILLPTFPNLLTSHESSNIKYMPASSWKISGNTQEQILFQERLPLYTPKHGDQELEQLTRVPGESGLTGVVLSRLIQFTPL